MPEELVPMFSDGTWVGRLAHIAEVLAASTAYCIVTSIEIWRIHDCATLFMFDAKEIWEPMEAHNKNYPLPSMLLEPFCTQYLLPSLRTSPYSSRGLLLSLVSFHKFGVKKPYVLPTATNVAFNVFSRVLVEPEDDV